jgi:hypothetical protein
MCKTYVYPVEKITGNSPKTKVHLILAVAGGHEKIRFFTSL